MDCDDVSHQHCHLQQYWHCHLSCLREMYQCMCDVQGLEECQWLWLLCTLLQCCHISCGEEGRGVAILVVERREGD